MGGQNISVHLDRDRCRPGDQVTGTVTVKTEKSLQINGISVKVLGRAEVTWNETEDTNRRRGSRKGRNAIKTITYSAREDYFCFTYNLMGSGVLGPGEFVFPFSTQLPAGLPSSFSCPYGDIKYGVKAKLVSGVNQKASAELFIDTPLDLNYEPHAMDESIGMADKFFGCCCCISGPLFVLVKLPHRGFVPGQVVCPILQVDNSSKVKIEEVVCTIKEEIWCKSSTPSHKERFFSRDLVETSVGGLGRGLSTNWRPNLLLPLQSVNNIRYCSIISLKHSLQVRCKVKGLHRDLSVEVPLVLGTEPVTTSQPQVVQPAVVTATAPPANDLPPPYPWQELTSQPNKTPFA